MLLLRCSSLRFELELICGCSIIIERGGKKCASTRHENDHEIMFKVTIIDVDDAHLNVYPTEVTRTLHDHFAEKSNSNNCESIRFETPNERLERK